MKYHIYEETGEKVAEFDRPVDSAHGYLLFGNTAYITTHRGRRLFPFSVDHPDCDRVSSIAAKLLERSQTRANPDSARSRRKAGRPAIFGIEEIRKYKALRGTNGWKKQSKERFIARSAEQQKDALSQPQTS